jgi:ring-1,2-phenylacetyl-CoA epoxidase subunit PaaD
MLRGVARDEAGRVRVALSPTYTGCPATSAIRLAVEAALLAAGIPAPRVDLVLAPPWTTDDITEAGRDKLRAFGIAPPVAGSRGSLLFAEETVACPRCGSTSTARVSEFGSTPCKAHWRCASCGEPFDYFKCL